MRLERRWTVRRLYCLDRDTIRHCSLTASRFLHAAVRNSITVKQWTNWLQVTLSCFVLFLLLSLLLPHNQSTHQLNLLAQACYRAYSHFLCRPLVRPSVAWLAPPWKSQTAQSDMRHLIGFGWLEFIYLTSHTHKLQRQWCQSYKVALTGTDKNNLTCSNSEQHKPYWHYCYTNFDKSTLFKEVLKAGAVEKWCGSAGKLFHGSTTLLMKKCLYTSTRMYAGNSLYLMTTRTISTVKSEKHIHIEINQIKNNFIHQYQIMIGYKRRVSRDFRFNVLACLGAYIW